MVSDSAATASAMYTGQKTTFFTMGYDSRYFTNPDTLKETKETKKSNIPPSVEISKPESVGPEAEQTTMLDWAQVKKIYKNLNQYQNRIPPGSGQADRVRDDHADVPRHTSSALRQDSLQVLGGRQ